MAIAISTTQVPDDNPLSFLSSSFFPLRLPLRLLPGLYGPITDVNKIASEDTGQRIYVATNVESGKTTLLGYIKIGEKNLFYRCDSGSIKELGFVTSVLDFYVHESCQRYASAIVFLRRRKILLTI